MFQDRGTYRGQWQPYPEGVGGELHLYAFEVSSAVSFAPSLLAGGFVMRVAVLRMCFLSFLYAFLRFFFLRQVVGSCCGLPPIRSWRASCSAGCSLLIPSLLLLSAANQAFQPSTVTMEATQWIFGVDAGIILYYFHICWRWTLLGNESRYEFARWKITEDTCDEFLNFRKNIYLISKFSKFRNFDQISTYIDSEFRGEQGCFRSHPGGNLVEGLPPVPVLPRI